MSNGTVCIQLVRFYYLLLSQEKYPVLLIRVCCRPFVMAFILIQSFKLSLIENSSTASGKFMVLKNAVIVQNYFVYDLRFINLFVHKTLDTMAMATWHTYFRSPAHIHF